MPSSHFSMMWWISSLSGAVSSSGVRRQISQNASEVGFRARRLRFRSCFCSVSVVGQAIHWRNLSQLRHRIWAKWSQGAPLCGGSIRPNGSKAPQPGQRTSRKRASSSSRNFRANRYPSRSPKRNPPEREPQGVLNAPSAQTKRLKIGDVGTSPAPPLHTTNRPPPQAPALGGVLLTPPPSVSLPRGGLPRPRPRRLDTSSACSRARRSRAATPSATLIRRRRPILMVGITPAAMSRHTVRSEVSMSSAKRFGRA